MRNDTNQTVWLPSTTAVVRDGVEVLTDHLLPGEQTTATVAQRGTTDNQVRDETGGSET